MEKDTMRLEHVADDSDDTGELPLAPPEPDEHRVMGCRSCQLPRVFHRRKTRHSLHFALALGTLGLWLPFWGLIILSQRFQPWTCSVCRVHQRDQ